MNALRQPTVPPVQQQPVPKHRVTPRPKRHLRQRSYQIMALETTVKIGVNFAISAVAISTLTQLLPHHWQQQQKLREISTEVNQLEARVNKLQDDFSRNFDPTQAKAVMQEQSARRDPSQRPVVMMNRESTKEADTNNH